MLSALNIAAYTLKRVSVHDPSVVWEPTSQTYYIFGSHRDVAKSTNMMNWTRVTSGIELINGNEVPRGVAWATSSNTNAYSKDAFTTPALTEVEVGGVKKSLPAFDAQAWSAKGTTGTYDITGNLWAPDVIYNTAMKKWCMYMSVNGNNWYSSIVLLTADNIEGPYTYQAPIVISGFTNDNYKQTDLELVLGSTLDALPDRYKAPWTSKSKPSYPNNIDPCVFYDETGKLWMSYGSWFGGIFMLELDKATGLRDYTVSYDTSDTRDPYFGKKIAGGYEVSGEASYIEYIGGYYYLFMSYGGFESNKGYQMRVFRSTSPDGPYEDPQGAGALYNVYSENFGANSTVRGENIFGAYGSWGYQARGIWGERAQGHNSIIAAQDGHIYLVYHTRFQNRGEGHEVRVHEVFQNEDGWLVAAPFEYTDETLTNAQVSTTQQVAKASIAGHYKLMVHRNGLDHKQKEIVTPVEIELKSDGTITGACSGSWANTEGKCYVQITLDGKTYKGVMINQKMEPTDEQVVAFTAMCKSDGVSIWGYQFTPDEPVTGGDITTGIVAYYNFDNTTIANFYNNSQVATLQQEGTNSVPTLQTDSERSGKVIHTNAGSNGNTSSAKFANPLYNDTDATGATIAFWVNPLDENYYDDLIAFYDPETDANARLYMNANTYVGFNDWKGNWIDLNHSNEIKTNNITFGMWNFVVLTISSSDLKIYVDGVEKNFSTSNGSKGFSYESIITFLKSCKSLNFGYGIFWWGSSNALFDELLVYKRALTATDVKALYQKEVADNKYAELQPDVVDNTQALRYVGGDISMLPCYEEAGSTYLDKDGQAIGGDLIAYLKLQGWNSMRVRLFVDPENYKTVNGETFWNEGARQNLADVKALGKRIKDAGMKFMLDIHYSDTWTDPDKHLAPLSWTNSSTYADEVYSYTKDVLQQLVAYGATPDFIQVGNEVNNGMLWDNLLASQATNVVSASDTDADMTNFISYIKSGSRACREVCPKAKIVFHVAMDYANTNWAAKTWPGTLAANNVDYDIIGLSYYPYYHGPLDRLTALLGHLKTTYPAKEVQLVEVGYPHAYYPTEKSYDYTATYPATDDGQLTFTKALISALSGYSQVTGLYWWWPEANEYWKKNTSTSVTTNWYNYGLWDNETGKATQALYVLDDFLSGGVKVGATDNTTGYMAATSQIHTMVDGSSIHYTFTQTTNPTENWHGYLLYAGTADATPTWDNAYVILRGDNYEDKEGTISRCSNNFNWDTFKTDMNGATVDMYVTYVNGTFAMTSTITPSGSSNAYTYSYSKALDNAPASLAVCLSLNNACLTITKDEYEPPYTYFNDFENINGSMAYNAQGNAIIHGDGLFATDSNADFGQVFQNAANGTRTNYLMLPTDVLSHSAHTKQLTIGFWVNMKSATNFFFSPVFSAYGSEPSSTGNGVPMLVCEGRGLLQLNCDGWCDFGINDGGKTYNDGTPYVTTAWLDDKDWHYYTAVFTETTAKVYVDGELKNGWTVDGTSDGQKISGLFTSGSQLSYICLGGNQAWDWNDPDPAFAFDDVMITNKALTANEIAAIVNSKTTAVRKNMATIAANRGDITSMINGTFEANADGWTGNTNHLALTRSWRGSASNYFIERTTTGTMSYTLSNMPAGTYKVVAAARSYAGGQIQPEIAGTTGSTMTGVGDGPKEGNMEINTNGVEMPYSPLGGFTTDAYGHNWRWISATGALAADGDLTIKFNCTGTGWMAIDDVHLYCTNLDGTSYTRTVGDGKGTINANDYEVTADIVMENPNTVLRTTGTVTTAAGETMNNNQHNSSRITRLVLYDGYDFTKLTGNVGADNGAVLYRSIPAKTWNTLVVPFWPTTSLTKKYPTAFANGTLTFSDVDRATWGGVDKPMLIKSATAITAIEGKLASTNGGGSGITHNDMTSGAGAPMVGVYAKGTVPVSDATTAYYAVGASDNSLHKVTGGNVTLKPFRAYFMLTGATNSRSIIGMNFDDGETTAIGSMPLPAGTGAAAGTVYNLQGQRVAKPAKGLYIINGKKVMMK